MGPYRVTSYHQLLIALGRGHTHKHSAYRLPRQKVILRNQASTGLHASGLTTKNLTEGSYGVWLTQ